MELAFYGVPRAIESLAQIRPRTKRTASETEDAYTYSVVMPGVGKEDFSAAVEDNVLVIKAKSAAQGQEFKYEEKFAIPKDGDHADLKAGIANGVLTITVPKRMEEAPRAVEVAESGDRDENAYELVFQVPGAGTDNVKVELVRGVLRVSANASGQSYFPSFERAFKLPHDASSNEVTAFCKNGVLVVSVGKKKPETVPIAPDSTSDASMYSIQLRVPGVETDQISIERVDRTFTLRINSQADPQRQLYEHRFSVPIDVDAVKVVAEHKNGVLTIAGPKVEKRKQQVDIV